jgi:hypothetical protein
MTHARTFALALLLAPACAEDAPLATPVRATLDDGQVLQGEVQTKTLRLQMGFSEVEIPLDDIGEIQPVEGGTLAGSGNQVSVWLRNGSELRGQWAEPELDMGLSVGGENVHVALPMDALQRFQLQGGESMADGMVYRVRTVWGDDFVVDGAATWVTLENDLGTFTPTLDEVTELTAIDGGDWRMALETGSVLIGPLAGEALTLALPLGPEGIELPIDQITSIQRQDWGGYGDYRDTMPAQAGELDSGMWFDNIGQSSFKSLQ